MFSVGKERDQWHEMVFLRSLLPETCFSYICRVLKPILCSRNINLNISKILTHFMPLIFFFKTLGFLMFPGGIEKDQWPEMGSLKSNISYSLQGYTPLHLAAISGKDQVIIQLIECYGLFTLSACLTFSNPEAVVFEL